MTPAHVGPAQPVVNTVRRKTRVSIAAVVRCPDCGSRSVRRLHRNWMERLVTKVTETYPHICKDCSTKFFSMLAE
jgi:DNA-directed RNA polymerase subunit RPC12/RpoP